MQRCRPLSLSKLPKASTIKSIKFRRTTPGDPTPLLYPHVPLHITKLVDPSHPAAKRPRSALIRSLPSYHDRFLSIRAVPKALLTMFDEHKHPCPPFYPAAPTKEGSRVVNMSAPMILGKKSVHKSAVVRRKIMRKLKFAMSLIVTKGAGIATVGGDKGKKRVCIVGSDIGDAGREFILQNWTYVFMPKLEIYRMPHAELIGVLRKALMGLQAKARDFDRDCEIQSAETKNLTQQQPNPVAHNKKRPAVQSERPVSDFQAAITPESMTRTMREWLSEAPESPSSFPSQQKENSSSQDRLSLEHPKAIPRLYFPPSAISSKYSYNTPLRVDRSPSVPEKPSQQQTGKKQ